MLDVGIIGLGPDWETCYRPVLHKLRTRIRVRSVYSAVGSRADQVAHEFDCDPSVGIYALMERPDLRALLLLDMGWCEQPILQFACQHGKSLFIASRLAGDAEQVRALHFQTSERHSLVMPQFRHRYNPATIRLQELFASRLGRPKKILVTADVALRETSQHLLSVPGEREILCDLIDWCCYLASTAPTAIHSARYEPGDLAEPAVRRLVIEFRRTAAGGEPAVAEIVLTDRSAASASGTPADHHKITCEVQCAQGRATVESPEEITWSHAGREYDESLLAERSEVEVMLDHFCRRLVGGLIPVPTLEDLGAVLELVEAAEESSRRGMRIALGGPGKHR